MLEVGLKGGVREIMADMVSRVGRGMERLSSSIREHSSTLVREGLSYELLTQLPQLLGVLRLFRSRLYLTQITVFKVLTIQAFQSRIKRSHNMRTGAFVQCFPMKASIPTDLLIPSHCTYRQRTSSVKGEKCTNSNPPNPRLKTPKAQGTSPASVPGAD